MADGAEPTNCLNCLVFEAVQGQGQGQGDVHTHIGLLYESWYLFMLLECLILHVRVCYVVVSQIQGPGAQPVV